MACVMSKNLETVHPASVSVSKTKLTCCSHSNRIIVAAISNYTLRIQDESLDEEQTSEALRFLGEFDPLPNMSL